MTARPRTLRARRAGAHTIRHGRSAARDVRPTGSTPSTPGRSAVLEPHAGRPGSGAPARDPRSAPRGAGRGVCGRRPDRRRRPGRRARPAPRVGGPLPARSAAPLGASAPRGRPGRPRHGRGQPGSAGRPEALWITLGDGGAVGLLPGGADHPLWGPSDRLVHASPASAPGRRSPSPARCLEGRGYIPPVAEPARLPAGAGAALLNVLAALAQDQGRPALRYRGPYPSEQLFWSLTESFRFGAAGPGPTRSRRFLANAEATFARGACRRGAARLDPGAPRAAPPPGRPRRPAARRRRADRLAWAQLPSDRVPGVAPPGAPRRAGRRDGSGGQYVASLEALGTVVEDHLVLDAHGALLERRAPAPEDVPEPRVRAVARGARHPPAARGDPAPRGRDRGRLAGDGARVGPGPRRPRRGAGPDGSGSRRSWRAIYRAAWAPRRAGRRRAWRSGWCARCWG